MERIKAFFRGEWGALLVLFIVLGMLGFFVVTVVVPTLHNPDTTVSNPANTASNQTKVSQETKAKESVQWEYQIETCLLCMDYDEIEEWLNEQGEQGWEMIKQVTDGVSPVFMFKRRK